MISLFLIPLPQISLVDFCMRVSIPALVILCALTIMWLQQNFRKRIIRTCLIILVLLIGAVTPYSEMDRSYTQIKSQINIDRQYAEAVKNNPNPGVPIPPPANVLVSDHVRTFDNVNFTLNSNFCAVNYQNTFFAKYILKPEQPR